ncbi:Protein disks lost [Trichinella spiralis]|uniref:Protein disks lost n=1 Tax=Trichinella spiralis TaxID=6334 RepID=A0ABR3KLJ0_TRISP
MQNQEFNLDPQQQQQQQQASSFAGIGALVTTLTTSGRRLLTEATIDFIRIVDLSQLNGFQVQHDAQPSWQL